MKRLLTLIGSIGIIGGTSATIVACKQPESQRTAEISGDIDTINLFTKINQDQEHISVSDVQKSITNALKNFNSLISAIANKATPTSDKFIISASNLKVTNVYKNNKTSLAKDEDLTNGAEVFVEVTGDEGSNISGSVLIKNIISSTKIGLAQDDLSAISNNPPKVSYIETDKSKLIDNINNNISKIIGPQFSKTVLDDASGDVSNLKLSDLKFDDIYSDEKLEKPISNDDIKDGTSLYVKITPKIDNDKIYGYSYFKITLQKVETLLSYEQLHNPNGSVFTINANIVPGQGSLQDISNAVNNAINDAASQILNSIKEKTLGNKELITSENLQSSLIYADKELTKYARDEDVVKEAELYAKIVTKDNTKIGGFVFVKVNVMANTVELKGKIDESSKIVYTLDNTSHLPKITNLENFVTDSLNKNRNIINDIINEAKGDKQLISAANLLVMGIYKDDAATTIAHDEDIIAGTPLYVKIVGQNPAIISGEVILKISIAANQ